MSRTPADSTLPQLRSCLERIVVQTGWRSFRLAFLADALLPLMVLDRCDGRGGKNPSSFELLPNRHHAQPGCRSCGVSGALHLENVSYLHIRPFRLDLHFAQRKHARRCALPVLEPACAVKHLAVRDHADKSCRDAGLDAGPVLLLDRLPHQPLMLLRARADCPAGMLGLAGTASQ